MLLDMETYFETKMEWNSEPRNSSLTVYQHKWRQNRKTLAESLPYNKNQFQMEILQ